MNHKLITGVLYGMGKKIKWLIVLSVLLIALAYSAVFANRVVKPNMISLAEIQARSMITTVTTKAVKEVLEGGDSLKEMLEVGRDENGHIIGVNTWALPMSQKGTELSSRIQKEVSRMGEATIDVPLGAVLGSPVLSQANFSTSIRVKPLGVSKVSLQTEFEEKGINQTKYKVFLKVNADVKILAPFSKENFQVGNEYLLAEIIIVGDVPESYVIVPKDEVLDAIN